MIAVERLDASTVASDEGRRQIIIADGAINTHVYFYDVARLVVWVSETWAEVEMRYRWHRWTP